MSSGRASAWFKSAWGVGAPSGFRGAAWLAALAAFGGMYLWEQRNRVKTIAAEEIDQHNKRIMSRAQQKDKDDKQP